MARASWTATLATVLFVGGCAAFDLCILFGICQNAAQGGGGGRLLTVPQTQSLDGEWLQSANLNNGQAYHFASSAPAMDWYSAEAYCSNKNGFLAEPISAAEQQFLAGYASQFRGTSWWIGLRATENCQCAAGNGGLAGRSSLGSNFEASIDQESIFNSEEWAGPVRTNCPPGFEKLCIQPTWKWYSSGLKATDTQWNPDTGEPNSNQEHCVLMWSERSFNWADWGCKSTTSGQSVMRPICQKDIS